MLIVPPRLPTTVFRLDPHHLTSDMKIASVLRASLLLTTAATLACVAHASANPARPQLSAQQAIHARQDGFNKIGWATKAINDELKRRSPDMQKIAAGSGRESGFDTDALGAVWSQRARFDELTRQLVTESQRLKSAVATQDVGAIKAQFSALREVCSSCHRGYLAKR
jgi:cytochrome c556